MLEVGEKCKTFSQTIRYNLNSASCGYSPKIWHHCSCREVADNSNKFSGAAVNKLFGPDLTIARNKLSSTKIKSLLELQESGVLWQTAN